MKYRIFDTIEIYLERNGNLAHLINFNVSESLLQHLNPAYLSSSAAQWSLAERSAPSLTYYRWPVRKFTHLGARSWTSFGCLRAPVGTQPQ